ncbi:hypothetical protein FK178_09745 [Antarcticibacterium arcticum]|uniref:Uncharacterized protein n=1 Tax=Antarcticibacterium arcticum TaxID=2585771 RepID=A0A5B8YK30_9FLAO|nr:hypothetical protein [Antarcticibacterium arcticum]QED37991.1 hypothetical protein FK178_09745 [Antarcticibacterium arcticum]
MSQLTAHIVYATFKALDQDEKENFIQLIEEEKKKRKTSNQRKRKSVYDNLPAKYHPDNLEMLVAEIIHS